jgi:hypothetical protein
MRKVELKNGLCLELDEKVLNNMELVDALEEASEESPLAISKIVKMVLGTENRKLLYESLRNEDGRVPMEAISDAIKEIFEAFGEKGKN